MLATRVEGDFEITAKHITLLPDGQTLQLIRDGKNREMPNLATDCWALLLCE